MTLDGCLYSQAVSAVPSLHQLQHELITDMFQLSWPVTRAITAERSYAILDQEQTEPPWDLSNWWWQQRLEEHYGSNGLPPEFDPQEDKERLLHLQAPVVTIAHWKQGLPKEPMGQVCVLMCSILACFCTTHDHCNTFTCVVASLSRILCGM